MMGTTRVLVVDDSATMRRLLIAALSADPSIVVVGEACDPIEARQAIKSLNPDVLTLDIEMPNMNGLEFLEKIMRLRPMPVIMVSTLTKRGADETIRALEIGAIDCIEKPRQGRENAFAELPGIVKAAAGARLRSPAATAPPGLANTRDDGAFVPDGRVVAIGASTGGVEALIQIVGKLPKNCPPTVIVQHMPMAFTQSFAKRLDRICAPAVREALDGAKLTPGVVYLAPGGNAHMEVVQLASGLVCRLLEGEKVNGHRPSVDVLFRSVAKTCRSKSVGVILTGMGNDGASGLLDMKNAGAFTIGQDEATCVVYGMPKAAFDTGAVSKQIALERIGDAIVNHTCSRQRN